MAYSNHSNKKDNDDNEELLNWWQCSAFDLYCQYIKHTLITTTTINNIRTFPRIKQSHHTPYCTVLSLPLLVHLILLLLLWRNLLDYTWELLLLLLQKTNPLLYWKIMIFIIYVYVDPIFLNFNLIIFKNYFPNPSSPRKTTTTTTTTY